MDLILYSKKIIIYKVNQLYCSMINFITSKCKICNKKFLHYYRHKRKVCSLKCNGLLVSKRQKNNNVSKRYDVRKKISEKHKGMKQSKQTKIKISKALTGIIRKPFTEEHRKKISIKSKLYHMSQKAKLQDRLNGINTSIKCSKTKISKAEKFIKQYLVNNKIKFIQQYKFELGVADFYVPKYNLIIECYGSYWHSKPDYIERDKRKNIWLKKNKYKILILKSEKINSYNLLKEIKNATK